VKELQLPEQFLNWGEAIEAVLEARESNITPEQASGGVWEVFEQMAFLLFPKITR